MGQSALLLDQMLVVSAGNDVITMQLLRLRGLAPVRGMGWRERDGRRGVRRREEDWEGNESGSRGERIGKRVEGVGQGVERGRVEG